MYIYLFLDKSKFKWVEPFVIVGPIVAIFGFVIVLFSLEICIRYQKNARRVQDPEIDTMKNVHHIKHWIDPGTSCFEYILKAVG